MRSEKCVEFSMFREWVTVGSHDRLLLHSLLVYSNANANANAQGKHRQ